jgi:hypothetical protein
VSGFDDPVEVSVEVAPPDEEAVVELESPDAALSPLELLSVEPDAPSDFLPSFPPFDSPVLPDFA